MRKITTVLLFIAAACQAEPQTGILHQTLGLNDSGGPATLSSGNNNDWSSYVCGPSDGICRVTGNSGGSTLTGLDQANYGDRNVGVWIWNEGTYPITIAHANAGSSLNNRLHLRAGVDLVLGHGDAVMLVAIVDWTTDPYTPLGWHEIGLHARVDTVTTTTPTRVLGTAFQPSTTTARQVAYSASADCTISISGGMEGRVELLSDSANPPTTIRQDITGCKATGTVVLGVSQVIGTRGSASYLVPRGDYVLIRSVNVTGTPTYAITRQAEWEW